MIPFARTAVILVLVSICISCRHSPSEKEKLAAADMKIRRAQILYDHGLSNESKQALLDVYLDDSLPEKHRAEALYWLSSVAIHEGRHEAAAEDLERLTKEFPSTERAQAAAPMVEQFRQVVNKYESKDIDAPAAEAYLENGNFWARDAASFTIDSSWLPKEDMAAEWYDRVIQKFPRTGAAEEAYSKKIMVLLGWEDRGVYSNTRYGARRDPKKYMAAATRTYDEFEKSFPESGYLQSIRYQIAQAYWMQKDWTSARRWLEKIASAKRSDSDFYVHAAQNRLKKLEW